MTKPRRVFKCDKLTMEIIEAYPSAREAERANDLPCSSVYHAAGLRNVGYEGYVWRYEDDYDPHESFEGKCNRPVAIMDTKTKAVAVFETLKVATEKTGISYSILTTSMRKGYLAAKRYLVKYAR